MQGTALLFYGLIFGSIGTGLFIYGKKQRAPIPLVCGLILFVLPYVISHEFLMLSVGIILVAIPFVIKK